MQRNFPLSMLTRVWSSEHRESRRRVESKSTSLYFGPTKNPLQQVISPFKIEVERLCSVWDRVRARVTLSGPKPTKRFAWPKDTRERDGSAVAFHDTYLAKCRTCSDYLTCSNCKYAKYNVQDSVWKWQDFTDFNRLLKKDWGLWYGLHRSINTLLTEAAQPAID